MKIIYLPGNSIDNKKWIRKVKEEFGEEGKILYYDHWQSGEKWIDLERESEKLKEMVRDEKDYIVFAKSIGTILCLKGIEENYLKPKRVVFCGFPYSAGIREGLDMEKCLRSLEIPVLFIQNEFDPVGGFSEVEKILKKNSPKNYQLIKIANNSSHDYENYEEMKKLIETTAKK